MGQLTYVFGADLVGHGGVRRTIAAREDLTLVDLHYALQSAFGWDDDHLFAFWLHSGFWGGDGEHYVHPHHARTSGRPGRSACVRLGDLGLARGQQLSYVFDFAREWRVALTVTELLADAGGPSPRLLASAGAAPPQYPAMVAALGAVR